MKPSSRSGRFKKKLISLDSLQVEVPKFLNLFHKSLELFNQKQISEAELCAHYIIISLSLRYPGTWPGASNITHNIKHQLTNPIPAHIPLEPNVQKRLEGMCIGDLFNKFALKSTPPKVNRALLNFSTNKYPLELMFKIPTPREVLDQQKNGRRCLTLITKEKQMKDYILGERDYLGFCLHDLLHADHFYHSNLSYQGQLGLYKLLAFEMDKGVFDNLLENEKFEAEFEYIIADMNAYPIHLLKCLKSAIIHYGSKDFFDNWVKNFPVANHLQRLNQETYEPREEDSILLAWLNELTRE